LVGISSKGCLALEKAEKLKGANWIKVWIQHMGDMGPFFFLHGVDKRFHGVSLKNVGPLFVGKIWWALIFGEIMFVHLGGLNRFFEVSPL